MTKRTPVLRVLSAGAAKGVVQALAGPFEAAAGAEGVGVDATAAKREEGAEEEEGREGDEAREHGGAPRGW